MKKTKMRRIVSRSLALVCIVVLFVACIEEQADSEAEDVLSGDLRSQMFSLGDVVYTLPVLFSELEANGWSFCDTRNDDCFVTYMLEPGERSFWHLTNGELKVEKTFVNLSEDVLPVSESYIVEAVTHFRWDTAPIIFPGNIMLGSAYEDVIAAYGEPGRRRVNGEPLPSLDLFYSMGHFSAWITIDAETGLVIVASMNYWGER